MPYLSLHHPPTFAEGGGGLGGSGAADAGAAAPLPRPCHRGAGFRGVLWWVQKGRRCIRGGAGCCHVAIFRVWVPRRLLHCRRACVGRCCRAPTVPAAKVPASAYTFQASPLICRRCYAEGARRHGGGGGGGGGGAAAAAGAERRGARRRLGGGGIGGVHVKCPLRPAPPTRMHVPSAASFCHDVCLYLLIGVFACHNAQRGRHRRRPATECHTGGSGGGGALPRGAHCWPVANLCSFAFHLSPCRRRGPRGGGAKGRCPARRRTSSRLCTCRPT